MKIIDSNVWISFFNLNDINNKKAESVLNDLKNDRICVTEYIILEVSTILLQKVSKDTADWFINFIEESNNIHIVYSSQETFKKYMDFFRNNSFLKLSFVDQSLLFLSKNFEIITFDKALNKFIWDF